MQPRRKRPDGAQHGTLSLVRHLMREQANQHPKCGRRDMADDHKASKPDLTHGIAGTELVEGAMLAGHVGGDEVLLVRRNGAVYAIGAQCMHYHGPLAEGLLVGDTIRCPWHHACFDLKTGEAVAAPALSPLPCWTVDAHGGHIVVRGKWEQPAPKKSGSGRIVIIGGGAAGFAAAEMLGPRGVGGGLPHGSN